MRSKLDGEHGTDAEQAQALGGPVARRAHAVAFARHHHHRLVALRRYRSAATPTGMISPEGTCSVCAPGAAGASRFRSARL